MSPLDGVAHREHPTASHRLDSLQAFRGLAAVGVVLHHAAQSTQAFFVDVPAGLYGLLLRGDLGVDFFFVLSGFIILSSHLDDPKTLGAFRTYGLKRVTRIFPPYWPVSIVLLVSYLLLPGLSQTGRTDISGLSSVFLLPDHGAPALVIAWTLIHELLFYVVFAAFFVSNRVFVLVLSAWVAAIATTSLMAEPLTQPLLRRLLDPINLEFMLGMGVACLSRRFPAPSFGGPLLVAGLALFVALLWVPQPLNRLAFGLPFAMMVWGAALLHDRWQERLPRSLIWLGDASYSIYLVHNPVISVTTRLVQKVAVLSSWGMGLAVGAVVSVGLGFVYHHRVEKPLIRLFRRVTHRPG